MNKKWRQTHKYRKYNLIYLENIIIGIIWLKLFIMITQKRDLKVVGHASDAVSAPLISFGPNNFPWLQASKS